MVSATQEITPKIIPAKSASPWHRKSWSVQSARVPDEKKTTLQKIGSVTVGQTLGIATLAIGLGDFIYKTFYSDSDSLWNKYFTPALISLLGLSGASSSSSIPDVLGVDIISSGLNNVIEELKGLDTSSNAKFSSDSKDKIMSSLESIVSVSSNLGVVELMGIIQKQQNRTNGSETEFPSDADSENEILTLADAQNLLRSSWEEACSQTSRQLGNNYRTLFSALNEGLEQIGVYLDHKYDPDNNLVYVDVKSSNLISSSHNTSVNYQPFIHAIFLPENFKGAMATLNKNLSSLSLLQNQTVNHDKEILQALIQSLGPVSTSVYGYYEIDPNSNDILNAIPVHQNVMDYLPWRNRKFLNSFIDSSIVIPGFNTKIQTQKIQAESLKLFTGPELKDIKTTNELLSYIGGESFAVKDDDSNDVKALKYSFALLWLHKNGNSVIDSDTLISLGKNIQRSLTDIVGQDEYSNIVKHTKQSKLPNNYLNAGLFLNSLGIVSGETLSETLCKNISDALSPLDNSQQGKIELAIQEICPTFRIPSTQVN